MKRLATALITVGLLVPLAAVGRDCEYPDARGIDAGHDSQGYYIKVRESLGRNWPVRKPAEYLAREAGAVIIYFADLTIAETRTREWRGTDPLSCLRSFAGSVGLEVSAPAKGIWMVGQPEAWFHENTAITLFAGSLDPLRQALRPEREVGELERALLARLPVRDAEASRTRPLMAFAGLYYYWLSREGRDSLLVVATSSAWRSDAGSFTYKIFKVELDRSGVEVRVGCVWGVAGVPAGRLLAEIDEDFDGDGYRDFVFDSLGADDVPNYVVLSGKDGHKLFVFGGALLAVEKAASGAKRVSFHPFDQSLVAEPRAMRGAREIEPDDTPRVYRYSQEEQVFTQQRGDGKGMMSESRASLGDRMTADRALVNEVGDPTRVRVYVMGEARSDPESRVEKIRVPLSGRTITRITRAMVKAGYPAHILYEYKSPGYLAGEAPRKQASTN
jgi:hypothetical protein